MARTLLLLVAAILAVPGRVTAQDSTIVSAASYVDAVAPDSWASAFGGPLGKEVLVTSNKDLIAAAAPPQVTVAAGAVEAEFRITTRPPASSSSDTATLSNDNAQAAFSMPFFLSIPSGESIGVFTIRTGSVVIGTQTANIKARAGSVEKTAPLTVNPK